MTEIALRDKIRLLQESEAARAELQDEIFLTHKAMLDELSVPLVPITDDVIAIPLQGRIDSYRAQHFQHVLEQTLRSRTTTTVIIDLAGMISNDTQVVPLLADAVQTIETYGAHAILTALPRATMQALPGGGLNPERIELFASLPQAIAEVMSRDLSSWR